MDYQRAIEIITTLEKEFDVNSLKCEGIKVWPLIRQAIWKQVCQPHNNFMSSNQRLARVKNHLRPLKQRVFNFSPPFSEYQQNSQLRNASPVDVVFFSRAEDHTDLINGKLINRHLDPIIQLIETIPNVDYLKLELFTNKLTSEKNPRFCQTKVLKQFLNFLKPLQSNSIQNFKGFKQMALKASGIELKEEYFLNQIYLIRQYELFYFNILSKINPSQLFLVCYYYLQAMALISACKKLNIKTIEVQHGKQGKYHGMYTHWTQIPEDGYEFLPDYFWSWGQESKENIEKWHPKFCNRHQPIVGGNCWLANWINGEGYKLGSDVDNFISSLNNKYRKVILVTLQRFKKLTEIIPEFLAQAMLESSDNWIWLVRLHPLQRNRLEEIKNYLNQFGINNFEIEKSTSVPLYALLKHSHNHITCWSSVCYEALLFQVPTIIIHSTGLQIYQQYINEGKFSYSETTSEVLIKLNEKLDPSSLKEETPYIETDLDLAKNTLNKLITDNI
ncbi:UDP-N-acetyl glucosamine 2-epimerase [Dactylococcopsis salina]|uniref:UDP-N-acetylglucosamine 2-epimerase n=1 Tax=Dactylococcopsis salina (strain PCC 8305) TaxID=13035 RepID=K9YQA1_DACS8|nr:UDP-N-acetyl glucosamine 2-epimerase [Dactylococcopsis salina]AFZ49069.1 UDP-N-acetylglucosamine 2-epimerase [Dactylococcopsis salina PCC 8305]